MRPIEFRTRNKKTKAIIKPEFDGDLCVGNEVVIIRDFKPNKIGGYSYYKTRVFDRLDIIVEQFTGLFDKNGKKIFEGDIIEAIYRGHGKELFYRKVLVTYNVSACRFEIKSLEKVPVIEPLHTISSENIIRKIIGNKFDNPELLENS